MQITDWFIDVDTHITEPGDIWTSRLPKRFLERAPRIVRSDDGIDTWQFGRTTRPIPVGATAIAGWGEPFPACPRNMDECPPASYDARARLEYMDEIGVCHVGILPRNPHLRIVSVESGIGWIPFVHEALDYGFEYTGVQAEKPEFEKKPSEYIREQVWACTFFEEFAPQSCKWSGTRGPDGPN